MNMRIESVDIHEERTVRALLDSGTIELFMSKSLIYKGGLIKLDQPLLVENINSTGNNRSAIIHKVKVNIFFKRHVKRV